MINWVNELAREGFSVNVIKRVESLMVSLLCNFNTSVGSRNISDILGMLENAYDDCFYMIAPAEMQSKDRDPRPYRDQRIYRSHGRSRSRSRSYRRSFPYEKREDSRAYGNFRRPYEREYEGSYRGSERVIRDRRDIGDRRIQCSVSKSPSPVDRPHNGRRIDTSPVRERGSLQGSRSARRRRSGSEDFVPDVRTDRSKRRGSTPRDISQSPVSDRFNDSPAVEDRYNESPVPRKYHTHEFSVSGVARDSRSPISSGSRSD